MHSAGGAAAKVAKRRAKAADPAAVPEIPKTLDDAATIVAWIGGPGGAGRDGRADGPRVRLCVEGHFSRRPRNATWSARFRSSATELADARKESPRAVVGAIRGQ